MAAYAIAHLDEVDLGAEIIDYIRRIDATLTPYDGAFLIHGSTPEIVEGPWPGGLVIIGFPDMERARGWYDSPAYRAILPLRTAHSRSVAMLVAGCGPGYRATDFLVKAGLG